ncbi:hypothetical protein [Nocardiopsis baichengensis]|uniref:hypothetical protein n=1 Tax=Nocardiopsis baichengensis TaxID=280240 RepID=UPI00034D4F5F|nr:hypothetical protein [Nocardiopsis baichengensis]
MSYDVVALVTKEPDQRLIADAMVDTGKDLLIQPRSGGRIMQLLSPEDEKVLLTIEPPRLIEVLSEIDRLLGPNLTEGLTSPCWWIEAHADPEVGPPHANRFAESLAWRLGGAVWTSADSNEEL